MKFDLRDFVYVLGMVMGGGLLFFSAMNSDIWGGLFSIGLVVGSYHMIFLRRMS